VPKGKSMVELTYSPQRLLYPLLRHGDVWRPIPYQEAVDLVAEKLTRIKEEYPEDYEHRVALFAPLWESREANWPQRPLSTWQAFPISAIQGTGVSAIRLHLEPLPRERVSPTTLDEILHAEAAVLFGVNVAEIYPPYVRGFKWRARKGSKSFIWTRGARPQQLLRSSSETTPGHRRRSGIGNPAPPHHQQTL